MKNASPEVTQPQVVVIIPYYQFDQGVLSRALRSVASQDYPVSSTRVLIVDDGSPWSAEDELASANIESGLRIEVLVQENAGPGAARNTALQHIENGNPDYVAYLDSDDEWSSDHLSRGIRALEQGGDAYFADLVHLGHTLSTYVESGVVDERLHPAMPGEDDVRLYCGDMTNQIVSANMIFMPSLIIKMKTMGHVRFPDGFRYCGEDYLYWLELTRQGAKYVFSTRPEVECGKGYNMWYASDWGTDGLARRLVDEARFRRRALDDYIQDSSVKIKQQKEILGIQWVFIKDIFHRLKRKKDVDWALAWNFLKEEPPRLFFWLDARRT
jgi:succinoglycan biosynthesis protein ExoW